MTHIYNGVSISTPRHILRGTVYSSNIYYRARGPNVMSYTEEIYERVVAQNPGEPEFHQAVKEVLDSLKLVIDANEEKYRAAGLLERMVEPERIISFKVPW